MALANCKECSRLFNQTFRTICPACEKEEDQKFFLVRDYLRANRGATPYEVSENTGVSLELIYKWVREKRILATEYTGLFYNCERCGNQITSGKYCSSCSSELSQSANNLKESVGNDETKGQGKGYYSRK